MMRKQILTLLGAGLIGLMYPTASQATLLVFSFSFSNQSGNVNGTVTGEIFGLMDNATGPASEVVIDSYPAGLGFPTPPQPLTIFPVEVNSQIVNSFTVSSGVLTAAAFFGQNQEETAQLEVNDNHENGLFNLVTGIELSNGAGLGGATYTLASSQSIPEPSSVAILMAGLGLAALWQLRQWRRRRWAAA